jgi:diguanylate cyclase
LRIPRQRRADGTQLACVGVIVVSTIALGRSLHATVVAEGPETEEQVRFLRANGCDMAQGFYFSRPIPADELAALLRKGAFALPEVRTVSVDG